jgi:hypothetical protein
MDIILMRHNLINAIMQTTDFERLALMYDMVTNGKKEPQTIEQIENVETVVEKTRTEIPLAEIKKGVTLEEIQASQKRSKMTYEEFSKLVAEEEWEQSLEELLASLD